MKSDNVDCKWVKIPNPYIFGIPIQCDEIFVGREVLIKRIIMKLESNPVWVIGQRRMGMTSLLLYIQRHYFKSNIFVSVFLSVEKIVFSSMNDFLFSFCRPIALTMKEYQIISDDESKKYLTNIRDKGLVDFLMFFEIIIDRIKEQRKKVVLLIDHYPIIIKAVEDGKIDSQFTSIWNKLLQNNRKDLKIVYSGAYNIQFSKSRNFAEMTERVEYLKVSFLYGLDVRKLISKPLLDKMQFEDSAFKYLMELTNGHAFFTQIILSYLVDKLNKDKKSSIVSKDIIEEGICYYLEQMPNLQSYWNENVFLDEFKWDANDGIIANAYKKLIITAITDNWLKSQNGLSKNDLVFELEMSLTSFHKLNLPVFEEVIKILSSTDEILAIKNNLYFIRVGLFREWIINKMHFSFGNTLDKYKENTHA